MGRTGSRISSAIAAAAVVAALVPASAASAAPASIRVSAGYVISVPESHPALTVSLANASVLLPVRCSPSGPVAGTVDIPLSSGPYSIAANDQGTYPSANDGAASTYQGSVDMPDLCNGHPMYLYYSGGVGATLSGDLQSTDTADMFHVEFHYRIPVAKGFANVDCADPAQNPGPDGTAACQGAFSDPVVSLADGQSPSPLVPDSSSPFLFVIIGSVVIGGSFVFIGRRRRPRRNASPPTS